MSMQIPDLRAAFASVRAGVPPGSAEGWAAAGPAGRSAVSAASSPYIHAASAWFGPLHGARMQDLRKHRCAVGNQRLNSRIGVAW